MTPRSSITKNHSNNMKETFKRIESLTIWLLLWIISFISLRDVLPEYSWGTLPICLFIWIAYFLYQIKKYKLKIFLKALISRSNIWSVFIYGLLLIIIGSPLLNGILSLWIGYVALAISPLPLFLGWSK